MTSTTTSKNSTQRSTKSKSSRTMSRRGANAITYLFLVAGALVILGPFLLSLMTALKSPVQFRTTPALSLPDPITFENFAALFGGSYNFIVPIAVTSQVVLVLVTTQMLTSILAAYAFAVLKFPGRDGLFWVYVACLMIPAVVVVIPLYSMMAEAGLRNTFAGLVVPFLFAGPYAIFLLRENFRSTPTDILDAAKLDGAGTLRTLFRVMVPMNTPIITTLGLITIVSQWNNFMWPLIITSGRDWQVITVATANLQSQYNSNWTLVMAATTVAMAPLLVLFAIFQRSIVSSISLTGFK